MKQVLVIRINENETPGTTGEQVDCFIQAKGLVGGALVLVVVQVTLWATGFTWTKRRRVGTREAPPQRLRFLTTWKIRRHGRADREVAGAGTRGGLPPASRGRMERDHVAGGPVRPWWVEKGQQLRRRNAPAGGRSAETICRHVNRQSTMPCQ
jgi:hypothetical protein